MELVPYVMFDGNCAEAFKFYEKCLGGKIVALMTHGEAPTGSHMPPDWQDKVVYARIEVGNWALMGSDAPPQYQRPRSGISVCVTFDTPAEGERAFNALAEGGTVQMPLQESFFSPKFGSVVDRFGTPWMILGGVTMPG